ncbi:28S ribosomal protein S18b, mitochondrial [Harpegnathos saltator]|uniref:Small ribosomal subunit protein mS40 n=1 Tax=Harpegnathos saltator TaxID=610380 RepID=E2B898_HARSA|nr:28S ribosomal protein S18b, mitochondrial [Harpegnathos saltator]EFN88100.1 28S ribosomal protein S18b, mitochondrial [Harpegnathos saltator]
MSILNTLYRMGTLVRANLPYKLDPVRSITYSFIRFTENAEKEDTLQDTNATEDNEPIVTRKQVSVETSIKYMTSDAYKQTYGNNPVWKLYKRNHKGLFPPTKTRKTCIRKDKICGNPCPICRDEYLILDHRNIKLLEQFIDIYNGNVLSYQKTGVCQKKHKELLVALTKAKDYGIITFDVAIRQYDYSEWQQTSNK